MNRKWFVTMLAGCVLLSIASADAAVVTIGASKDATIFQNHPNNGSGAGNGLFAGTNGALSPRRALIGFDVAANVPASAVIHDVQLTLVLGMAAGSGGGGGGGGGSSSTIELHRLAADWGEANTQVSSPLSDSIGGQGQGAAALAGDVTWNSRFQSSSPATPWTLPGGDFAATSSASTSVGSTPNASFSWNAPTMVSDVQGWLDNPSTNFGWLLLNADETSGNTFRAFYSRNVATASVHPQLQITYAIPEPATVLLFGVAGCFALTAARSQCGCGS
jgi:hypothetical protein